MRLDQVLGELDEHRALERLVVNNQDLHRLEGMIKEFNLFEALGIVRQELRHSAMVAFMLDPREAHGLGDVFLRRLLQCALARPASRVDGVSPVILDVMDLDRAEVRREWSGIDVFVLDRTNRLAVIIENKVDSDEHSQQLGRYWEQVERQYKHYRIIGLLLTPAGAAPSDDRYIPIDYGTVAGIGEEVMTLYASVLGRDVYALMAHYVQLVRRHIMADSDIAALCRGIYRKHRRALDLIFEHRPDLQQEVREILEELIKSNSDLAIDDCQKSYVRFALRGWDWPALKSGSWTSSGRVLLFEFQNFPSGLVLKLYIGPGPERVREFLFGMKDGAPGVFVGALTNLRPRYTQIFASRFATKEDLENASESGDLRVGIESRFAQFITGSLPEIDRVVRSHKDWFSAWSPEPGSGM